MNDLEDRLRADFLQATAGVEDTVDAERTLLAGQRARSSRRIGATAGITAMVAVAGVVGWSVLRVMPISGGVPSPMETISALPSNPSTTRDPMSTTFDVTGNGGNKQHPDYDSITVAVQPGGATTELRLTFSEGGLVREQMAYSIEPGKVWYVPWGRNLVLGIVPDRVAWFTALDETTKGVSSAHQSLEGIGGTAFWLNYEQANGGDSIRGFIWEGTDGVVRDSLGGVVPAARVSLEFQDYLVYRDPNLNTMGLVPSRGGSMSSARISDFKREELVKGGIGSKANGGSWEWTQFGFLPPGAHNIKVKMATAAGEWGSAALDDGWVAVVAHSTTKATNVIASMTYTDDTGTVVTYHQ